MKEKNMQFAIKEATKAFKIEEMPVGAIIVYKDKIVGKGYNKKEKNKNSLMHAEIIAINKACKYINDWRLNDCEMYVTMEPCIMCMGAIIESRIKKIYYGSINKKSHSFNLEICKNEKIDMECIENDAIKKQLDEFFYNIRNKQTNVR